MEPYGRKSFAYANAMFRPQTGRKKPLLSLQHEMRSTISCIDHMFNKEANNSVLSRHKLQVQGELFVATIAPHGYSCHSQGLQ